MWVNSKGVGFDGVSVKNGYILIGLKFLKGRDNEFMD